MKTLSQILEGASKDIVKVAQKRGWEFKRTSGSHHIFKHPDSPDLLVIPHPKKDLKPGIYSDLMKQAQSVALKEIFARFMSVPLA